MKDADSGLAFGEVFERYEGLRGREGDGFQCHARFDTAGRDVGGYLWFRPTFVDTVCVRLQEVGCRCRVWKDW